MTGSKLHAFFAFCFVSGTFLSGVMEGQVAFAVTTLTADITETDTVIEVTNTADFLSMDEIYIEDELVSYTEKDSTHFNDCTRGLSGTTAAAHVAGTKILNENSNVINNLLGYNVATSAASYGSFSAVVGVFWNLVKALPKMIAWNYSYLEGQWSLLKYFFLWPISAGFVFSLGLVFVSAVMGIFKR